MALAQAEVIDSRLVTGVEVGPVGRVGLAQPVAVGDVRPAALVVSGHSLMVHLSLHESASRAPSFRFLFALVPLFCHLQAWPKQAPECGRLGRLRGRLPGTKAHWAGLRSSRKLVGRAPSPALIGGVAEWLGRGLQNLSQRFNSAPRL